MFFNDDEPQWGDEYLYDKAKYQKMHSNWETALPAASCFKKKMMGLDKKACNDFNVAKG